MKSLFTILLIIITTSLYSQNIEWETNLGGSLYDIALSIDQTTDGGYIIAGLSYSSDGDVSGNNGYSDYWIVKLDASGNLVWETNLGGSSSAFEEARSVVQTIDGGYIVAGFSHSSDGDVGGNNGSADYWIVKLDANGNLIWETNLGGSGQDHANSIQQTVDGGFIVAGFSFSSDGDVGGNNGSADYWIVKLDANGNLVWETNLGGSVQDRAYSIQQSTDEGYIVAGVSFSSDGDVGGNNGGPDYWIVKLNADGSLVWETNLGGSGSDDAMSIAPTTDGGYIVAGKSNYFSGDVGGNNGDSDYWIVKLDANGNLVWETNLGGSGSDTAKSITPTTDSGFIIAGVSYSTDGDVGGNNGGSDYWIVKLDANGNLIWETNLGGNYDDNGASIAKTIDNGYIIAGSSFSSDGDVGGNNGGSDYWIIKLEGVLGIDDNIASKISISPNPTTNTITIANISQEVNKIEILDMKGRLVLTQNKVINNTINISNLQSATYLVKIHIGRTVFYKKVIKI